MARNERGIRISESFINWINRGNQKKYISKHIFSRNPDVGLALEDIWTVGGIYDYNIIPEIINFVSDESEDSISGLGARQILFEGIDGNFDGQSEIVDMSGTTVVSTIDEYLRMNLMSVYRQGTYGKSNISNSGTIIASGATTTKLHGEIRTSPMKMGQSLLGRHSIPRNYFATIDNIIINVIANRSADVLLFVRENAMKTTAPFGAVTVKGIFEGVQGFASISPKAPIHVNATSGADIWFVGSGSGNNTKIDITFDIHCYPIR